MAYVINYVGAGGKTSSILEAADEYRRQGKRVVITTSTHMLHPRIDPEGCDILTDNPEDAKRRLDRGEIVWYGHMIPGNICFTMTGDEEWEKLLSISDVVLVEGDGSRRRPVKVPKLEKEPVIFKDTDRIIIVFGMSSLGKTLKEICHRPELVIKLLREHGREVSAKAEEDLSYALGKEDLEIMIIYGYLIPMKERYPEAEISVRLNQVKDEDTEAAARWLAESPLFSDILVELTNYDREVRGQEGKETWLQ